MIYDAYLMVGGDGGGPVPLTRSWQFYKNPLWLHADIVKFTRKGRKKYRFETAARLIVAVLTVSALALAAMAVARASVRASARVSAVARSPPDGVGSATL
jgi:hypothetical protein